MPTNKKPTRIRTSVTLDGCDTYEAVVDPTIRWNGFVAPAFTLDTVRRLASDTQAQALEYGHDCVDTIHVIDGGRHADHSPRAVVLHARWVYMQEEGPSRVATVLNPGTDGLYSIGGFEWT